MPGAAVVTGANRGLGFVVAKGLAERGHAVIAVSRTAAAAGEAVKTFPPPASGAHKPLGIDLASLVDPSAAQSAADKIREAADGEIEILVNNAGVYIDRWDEPSWNESIAVNYIAPIRLSEQLMPNIVDGGTIVHVSSGYGSLSNLSPSYHKRVTGANDLTELLAIPFDPADEMRSSFVAPYKVSKAMLNRATQLMAAQNTRDGRRVSVSAVCPGWCRTRMGGQSASRSAEQGGSSILWATDNRPDNCVTRDGEMVAW